MAKSLKKNAVLVKDAPAFVVNRLLIRTTAVITQAVDDGTPVEVADAALRPLGLPMPPFVLLQLVGPAVALHVTETLHARVRRPVSGVARTSGRWSPRASPASTTSRPRGSRTSRRRPGP